MHLLNNIVVKTLPLVPRTLVRKFANRYIAGDNINDAINVVKKLNDRGIMATIDFLGEDVINREDAIRAKEECLKILDNIDANKLKANESLKLTSLGLKIDYDFCLANLTDIVAHAESLKQFIRIDMEDSTCTTDTINIYREIRNKFNNVGIVIQSYLRRSMNDVLELVKIRTNFRLCKGIYSEPEEIAFKSRTEIQENFVRLLRTMLENGCYVGIATHDEYLVEQAYSIISQLKLQKNQYEFQMLLGVREGLRDSILNDGHRLRVYVPYGTHWYEYSLRRFKENPEIAGYVVKNIFNSGKS